MNGNVNRNKKFLQFFLIFVLVYLGACIRQPPLPTEPSHAPVVVPEDKVQYSQIIEDNPGSIEAAEAHFRLGLELLSTDENADAIFHFDSASDIADASPWNVAASVELLRLTKNEQEIDFCLSLNDLTTILNDTKPAIPEMTQRTNFLLAECAISHDDWESAYVYIVNAIPLSGNPRDIAHYHTQKGCILSKLEKYQEAINCFQFVFDNYESHLRNALLEYLDILLLTNQPNRALEISMEHAELLTDSDFAGMFIQILKLISLDGLHQTAAEDTNTVADLLIRCEIVSRLLDDGALENAAVELSSLYSNYSDFSDYLHPLSMAISSARSVIPEHIGLLIPLSGNLASIGHSIFRGAQFALANYEQSGGTIPFELDVQDTGDTIESAIAGFQQLVDNYHVLAVVGPVRSAIAEALAPHCADRRVVLLTPGSPRENITDLSSWLFRIYPSIRHEMTELVRFSVRDLGILSFACVYPDTDIGIQGYDALQSVIQEENADLVFAGRYSADLSNLKSVLSSLTDSSADIIVIPDHAERAGAVAGQLRYKEILTPTIAGIGAWEEPDLLEIAGNHLDGSYFTASFPSFSGRRKKISEGYSSHFGEQADTFALRSFEAVSLIIQSVEKGIFQRAHLRNHFQSGSSLEGLDGKTCFSPYREYMTPILIYRILESQIEPWRIIPVSCDATLPGSKLQLLPSEQAIPDSPIQN